MHMDARLACLAAAILTAGATYAYARPMQDYNNIAFWRTVDGSIVSGYNVHGQTVEEFWFSDTDERPRVVIRNAYDRDGNRIKSQRTRMDGKTDLEQRWTYDRDGRMLTQTQIQGDDQLLTSYAYELDEQGRVTQRVEVCAGETRSIIRKTYRDIPDGGWCETAVYEGMPILDIGCTVDLLSLLEPDAACMQFGQAAICRDAQENVQKITVPDDGRTQTWDYTYDEQNRPVQIVETLDGRTVCRMTIAYDADGLRSRQTVYDGAGRAVVDMRFYKVDGPPII